MLSGINNKIYVFIFFCFIILSSELYAENSADADLQQFNKRRNAVTAYGMTVLGSWAIGNMALGAAFYGSSKGSDKYFHEMNIAWNAINLTIAGFGLYNAVNSPADLTALQSINEQQGLEKFLLLNAGLDVGYIMTGFFLQERSKNVSKQKNRLKGYGQSLVMQGGFLFIFDIALYFIVRADSSIMKNIISIMDIQPNGIGFVFRF